MNSRGVPFGCGMTFLLSMVSFEPLANSLEANSQTNLIGQSALISPILFFVLGVLAYLVPLPFAFQGFVFRLQLTASNIGLASTPLHSFGQYFSPPSGATIVTAIRSGLVGGHGGEILKAFIGFGGLDCGLPHLDRRLSGRRN